MIILYSIVFRVIVQSSLKIFEVMNHRTIVFVIRLFERIVIPRIFYRDNLEDTRVATSRRDTRASCAITTRSVTWTPKIRGRKLARRDHSVAAWWFQRLGPDIFVAYRNAIREFRSSERLCLSYRISDEGSAEHRKTKKSPVDTCAYAKRLDVAQDYFERLESFLGRYWMNKQWRRKLRAGQSDETHVSRVSRRR